ncbi:MAG: hypothetical protein WKF51_02360 [Geodermatophilaceae bacterium]
MSRSRRLALALVGVSLTCLISACSQPVPAPTDFGPETVTWTQLPPPITVPVDLAR